ncbi:CaiB/BaiF CoA transferase family protein [Salibacterium aidingense]|uniref:CaiB/BaiF CoA transferase family protein n=1 Tax=Salibacterium aidingense TaxID=384933 RepID=UPI003BE3DF1F
MAGGPLEGVKIIDFTQMMAGPWSTQILADLGAEVIKIERPDTGEWERGLASMGEFLEGDSPFFLAMNRNKKSFTLNLKNEKAKELIYKLVKDADVVAENFRPGVLDRLDLGYDKLSSINSGIIYLSSSGYGSSGPYYSRPGQDLLLQGMSGMLMYTGKGGETPTPAGTSVVDEGAAMMNSISVLAALYYKQRTGEGQKIEVSMLDTAISMQCQEATAYLNLNQNFEKSISGIGSPWLSAPFGVYPTMDGYMTIAMADMKKLSNIFGLPELKEYGDEMDTFYFRDTIKTAIEGKTVQKNTGDWLQILGEHDIWCGPVNSFKDVFDDEQVQHNEIVKTLTHPKAGDLKVIGFPGKFSKTPAVYHSAAPLIGEHNHEILNSLGINESDISKLEQEGVTSSPEKVNGRYEKEKSSE